MAAESAPPLQYQSGFGNEFSSEALPGALPQAQNNPKTCPYGLYAEQLSGTHFTAPRVLNRRSWLYRIRPSVTHEPFHPINFPNETLTADFSGGTVTPNQLRWRPFPIPSEPVDWVRGLFTLCGTGKAATKEGFAIHVYACNQSMHTSALANADGDFLIVPQQGALRLKTEFGLLDVAPGEVAVVPRGVRFAVVLHCAAARGYVLETFQGHFTLPDLGPIGANGLANPRDFMHPVAWYEDVEGVPYNVLHKLEGHLFTAAQTFSPFNVVAWHGNYLPYKYDLARFCPVNAVAFDHPDPSIFTVLTVPGLVPGSPPTADFVIFPPRWLVAEHTFRPPYYHRNTASEFMGLIRGQYEAKQDGGFRPGGASLHLCMTPHGPDTATFERAAGEGAAASAAPDGPSHLGHDTLAFMFETTAIPRITPAALGCPAVDRDYYKCWVGLKSHFDPTALPGKAKLPGHGGGAAPAAGPYANGNGNTSSNTSSAAEGGKGGTAAAAAGAGALAPEPAGVHV
ncbi:hypothetical protein HYH02_014313 [Chlamydomonas schloesseri]|uniref:homogentisate 1,2-dioxygenase n=1 Tax=Chlamydomonas schloesseri TaxID=2026947 RepID=A0A835SNZ1_9CHLO|nr:hypothetical protein HYH02_014313 [Chlamydomonas schloesseri]|eukprot:KAG2428612.1 hypothetical protein HYH02_014313 [Chlamydomonas schloesseri]